MLFSIITINEVFLILSDDSFVQCRISTAVDLIFDLQFWFFNLNFIRFYCTKMIINDLKTLHLTGKFLFLQYGCFNGLLIVFL